MPSFPHDPRDRYVRLAVFAAWLALIAAHAPARAGTLRAPNAIDPLAITPAAPSDGITGSALDGVRVLRADDGGVSFELSVPEPVFTHAGAPGEDLMEAGLLGFEAAGALGSPGLPERVIWIGVPPGARIEVEGVGLDAVEYGPVRLAPMVAPPDVPAEERARQSERSPLAGPPERLTPLLERPAYSEGMSRGPVAELASITGMRSQTVAGIRCRPSSYVPGAGVLRVFGRLAVTVRFVGGSRPVVAAEPEPAFEPVYRAALINYESARSFRTTFGGRRGRDLRSLGRGTGVAGTTALGFGVSPSWIKVLVDRKGIQRLSGDDLQAAGVSLAGVVPGQLRLFTRPGVPLLGETSYCDTCGLAEVAIRVVGGGDGRFDASDYILFYGLPPSGWRDEYVGPGAPSEWLDHPYENNNVYWLTWQASLPDPPRRWASRDAAPSRTDAWSAPYYSARLHFEVNAQYRPNDYEPGQFWDQWVWSEFNDQISAQQFLRDAPGAVTDQPARLFARFWGQSTDEHTLDVTFNSVPLARRFWGGRLRKDVDSTAVWIRETGNRFTAKAVPNAAGRSDRQALVFWELYFKRRFTAANDVAEFASPDTMGPVAYGLAPFSGTAGSVQVLDTSDPLTPVELVGWVARDTTGGKALYFDDDVTGPRFYFASSAANFRRPRVQQVEVRNLRGPGLGADYVVIVYDDFEPQAQRLAELRRRILPGVPNPTAAVVRMSDVLSWYAGGRMDPTAIRNFLFDISDSASGHRWSPVPSYVCFFGDASYDYKNVLNLARPGYPPSLVPSYVHGFVTSQFMTDDWLADMDLGAIDPPVPGILLSPNDIPDFFIGRLPAGTAAEASVLVDSKIVPYDERPTFGEWRNSVLLVADDNLQGFKPDGTPAGDGLWGVHQYQSEALESFSLPPVLDREKIYLIQYPFGVGSEKPGANADIRKAVNEGTLIWNFIGHGNPFKMADENAFIISDVPSLTNLDRLTFSIAASCDVGKFDDAIIVGLGEALVKSPVGGAIATYSSSDIAFSSQNSSLNISLLQNIFTPSAAGYSMSLGQASYLVKRRFDATGNDRKYTLQGDPGTRLGTPRHAVRMRLLDDVTGADIGDTLVRGRRVRIEGEVHGTHDTTAVDLRTDFQGTAEVWIADSAPLDTFSLYPGDVPRSYAYNPGSVFHGDVPVVSGRFTARFWVPLEGAMGPRAKARVYVQSPTIDGVGARGEVLAAGSPTEVDTTGPFIHLQFTEGGTVVPPDAELRIVLEDEHGINITGHSLPNAILLTLDGGSRSDLTELFRYDTGSFTRGTILFRLPNLAPGEHTIELSAADNFAQGIQGRLNRSRAGLDFTVAAGTQAALSRGYNFPNPFHPERGTQFIFDGLRDAGRVEISVFTVGGKVVRRLAASGGPGQVQVGWDGRDESGAPVANGVYLYRAQIFPLSGGPPQVLEGRAAAIH